MNVLLIFIIIFFLFRKMRIFSILVEFLILFLNLNLRLCLHTFEDLKMRILLNKKYNCKFI